VRSFRVREASVRGKSIDTVFVRYDVDSSGAVAVHEISLFLSSWTWLGRLAQSLSKLSIDTTAVCAPQEQ